MAQAADEPRPPEADLVVELLASGDTVREISTKTAKSESTIKRMMRDHRLRREANDIKAARASKTAARLAVGTERAVDVLVGNLEHENPSVQNASATKLLDQALRYGQISSTADDRWSEYAANVIEIYDHGIAVYVDVCRKIMSPEQFREMQEVIYNDEHIRRNDELLKTLSREYKRGEPS